MMAALISSHNGFMHAWGGVLLQDIILPFRKRPLEHQGTISGPCGRRSPLSAWWPSSTACLEPQQSILMYFAMVNSIWLGPAGAVMLGGTLLEVDDQSGRDNLGLRVALGFGVYIAHTLR